LKHLRHRSETNRKSRQSQASRSPVALSPKPYGSRLVAEVPDFEIRSGEVAANRLLDLPNPPTAIAASSDLLAFGAFHAITSRGLRIPDQVALVGNDDNEMAAIIRPALTTVSLPVAEAGKQAISMLEDMMAGGSPSPPQIVLDTELVIRETCGC